jgi:hypothetical protein
MANLAYYRSDKLRRLPHLTRRHTSQQSIRKLRETDRLLVEGVGPYF